MRRAAKALVEPVPARFTVSREVKDGFARLQAEVHRRVKLDGHVDDSDVSLWEPRRARGLSAARFQGRWVVAGEESALEGVFVPSPQVQTFLRATSLLLTLLILAGALVLFADVPVGAATRFLIPLTGVFAILGLPMLTLALASQKLAAEARIAKAIRTCFASQES